MAERITAMDVESQLFTCRFRGFDRDEVCLYLKSVAEEIERLNLANGEMRERLGRVQTELDDVRSREKALQQTLVLAQTMAEELKQRARAESELVLQQARFRAEQIVRQAQDQLARLDGDISRSRLERDNIERRLRNVIEQHLTLLDLRREARGDLDNVRVLPAVGAEAG